MALSFYISFIIEGAFPSSPDRETYLVPESIYDDVLAYIKGVGDEKNERV